MIPKSIKTKLDLLPDRPGVYLFLDREGQTVYIGKAASLKNRVHQYFRKDAARGRPNIRPMLAKTRDFEIIATDSEAEALILEANLVRERQPHYNMLLKDDKHFPYARVTWEEDYPRIVIARRAKSDGSRYFGPFTDVKNLRKTLAFMRKTFGIRHCGKTLPLSRNERSCLYHQIGRCAGPCTGKLTPDEYRVRVRQACDVLSGKSRSLLKELESAMQKAAASEDFEIAAALRDRAGALEKIVEKQKVDEADPGVSRDLFAMASRRDTGCMAVVRIREGLWLGKDVFVLKLSGLEEEGTVYSSFLRQYYLRQQNVPREIWLPSQPEDKSALEEWLGKRRNGPVHVHVPQKGAKTRTMILARRNADLALIEELGRRQAGQGQMHPAVSALQRELGLPVPPRRIECFDISNIQGTNAVGSSVCFVDAKARKSAYRRYEIKTVAGQDDFACMREVVSRRIKHRKDENMGMPDLLLVDGGAGHLSSAAESLRDAGLGDQPCAGLAKRLDEVFLPGRKDSIMLGKTSPALHLLQRIRDEAHRFAVTYHRKLRSRRTVASELDRIGGLGPKRKEALLRHFGSVARIREADRAQIAGVVGPALGQKIHAWFSSASGEGGQMGKESGEKTKT